MPETKFFLAAVLFACLAGALGALLLRMAFLETGDSHDHHGHPDLETGSSAPESATAPEVLFRVGNKKCPIMGGDVQPEQVVVLDGISIGICCPACDGDIRSDPAGTIRTLQEQPGSGPTLTSWLQSNPDVAQRLGLQSTKAASDLESEPPSSLPVKGRLMTTLANDRCPVDQNAPGTPVIADVEGLQVALCTEECRTQFMAEARAFLERLSLQPELRARIEAHRNLVARRGRGPHWHCALCEVRSSAPGPCPICAKPLAKPEGEPLYDLGNRMCPVMGDPIEGQGAVVEYQGLGVRICCPSCEKTFLQYPQYYLAKLEREQGVRVPLIVEETR